MAILFLPVSVYPQPDYTYSDNDIIYLCAPSINNPYYSDVFSQIIAFQADFVNSTGSNDCAYIVVDNATVSFFDGLVSPDNLLIGSINDIWIRDFATIRLLDDDYDFVFQPVYLDTWTANWIENSFDTWHNSMGFTVDAMDIILGGGNFVYDGQGNAVVTERIFSDNPSFSLPVMINEMNGLNAVAIIPEEPGGTTGRADGMVFWITPSILAVNDYEEPLRSEVLDALTTTFPDVDIVFLPYVPSDSLWRGWASCSGVYTNALATQNCIYVPIYGLDADQEALDLYEDYSEKQIIGLDASGVAMMGGSVHCLTWEVLAGLSGIEAASGSVIPNADLIIVSPNPFSSRAEVSFRITKPGFVNLSIYDISGHPVETPLNEYLDAGSHSLQWNPEQASTGIYFGRLTTDMQTYSVKILLVR